MRDVEELGLSFDTDAMLVPVHATDSGCAMNSKGITQSLVEQICTKPVRWTLATDRPGVTHIIDLGPGHGSGIGGLTHRNKDGSGVQVI